MSEYLFVCLCVCVCVQIKLADFGFARHFTEEGTKKPIDMHSLAGTPVFMVRYYICSLLQCVSPVISVSVYVIWPERSR